MSYVVFCQHAEPFVDLVSILGNARRYFEASIDVLSQKCDPDDPRAKSATFSLTSAKRGYSGRFSVTARLRTHEDLAKARAAEERGRAGGMALLAERCPTVWVVEPEDDTAPAATLNLSAILAATALGPVLPPDGSTLFGVRGAMERLEKLVGPE